MTKFRTSETFIGPSVVLIVVESIDSGHYKTKTGCQMYGNIRPTALVVCSPDGIYALDMEANPISVDRLRQDIPELNASIVSIDKV